jgi:hypothetical protein
LTSDGGNDRDPMFGAAVLKLMLERRGMLGVGGEILDGF